VTVAPVAVVTTDGARKMTPLVAATSIEAPATEALPLVKAYICNVIKEVPSAFKTVPLETKVIMATLAFALGAVAALAAAAGALAAAAGPPDGVPGFPPPPPQAISAAVNPNPAKNFKIRISTFL
ncbi:MAG: hypothetical protein PHH58_16765, partial [Rhodoferax sp.]|nr:hypothetical protein [Rhodoferax sp.]